MPNPIRKILVTNDDGWDAIGIRTLVEVAKQFGETYVVAPEKPQSGFSHQLTLHRSMAFVERAPNWFSLDGTPADCVRIGLTQLGTTFDCVLAGVNDGGNLGADLYLSGTVAAAREANFFSMPSLAISQYRKRYNDPFDWLQTNIMAARVLEKWFSTDHTSAYRFCNVNLPDTTLGLDPNTVSINHCCVDQNPFPANYRSESSGFVYSGRYSDREVTPGGDMDLCFGGAISWSWIVRDLNERIR